MTIRSMTGFGSALASSPAGEFAVEIKAVNNRFLDQNVRLPRELNFLEPAIRDEVKARVRRGKLDLFVRWSPAAGAAPLAEVNGPLLRHYATQIREALGLATSAPVDIAALLQLPGTVISTSAAGDDEALVEAALQPVRAALEALDETRRREGAKLAAAILEVVDGIERMCAEVESLKDTLVEETRVRIRERLDQIEKNTGVVLEPGRLEAEVILFADKADITEEVVRLAAHVGAMRRLCGGSQTEGVGKTMDFLVQELLREVNTIGNKARGLEISQRVVRMKSEIEKIREQVQNIE